MVLLRCSPGRRLTKLIEPSAIAGQPPIFRPFDNAFLFDAFERHHGSLDDIHRTLQKAQQKHQFCAVRGELIGRKAAECIRRLSNPDLRTGDAPTIRDCARAWVAVDVDSIPIPPSCDRRDVEGCGRAVISQLPAEFHDAEVIVQATAGHGFKPGARLRLWYWLQRPLTGAECKVWLRDAPVDPAVFRAAEPIYTAAPLFGGELQDPVPVRLAKLPGQREVRVPPPEAVTIVPPQRRQRNAPKTSVCPVQDDPSDQVALDRVATKLPLAKATLQGLIRKVALAREGERNSLTYWAACRFGQAVADEDMTEEFALELLVTAAKYAGLDEYEALATARSGLAQSGSAA